jgi:hypothetical protein
MTHIIRYVRRAQVALGALVLACALAACGAGPGEAAYGDSASGTSEEGSEAVFVSPITPQGAGRPGIDQTKIDVCALLPRLQVEAAIGPLEEEPRRSLAIGSEVGCEYTVAQGRGYEVSVYNLDRWDLIPQLMDVTPVGGLGDGAFAEKQVGGGVALYVLLRDRAVVGARVNGADTPQLRKLLGLALDSVR